MHRATQQMQVLIANVLEARSHALKEANAAPKDQLGGDINDDSDPDELTAAPSRPAYISPADYSKDHFPNYPWTQRIALNTIGLCEHLQLPASLKASDWKSYTDELRAPLHWYVTTLQWPAQPDAESSLGASWLELALDFWAATFVSPDSRLFPTPQQVDAFRLQEFFADATRAAARICGEDWAKLVATGPCPAIASTIGLPHLAGIRQRPIFKCQQFVAANLLQLVRKAGIARNVHNCKAISVPIDIQMPTTPLWNPSSGSAGPQVTRHGPHKSVKVSALRAADWSAAERTTIDAAPPRAQHRTMVILRHNRSAFAAGKHVIAPIAHDASSSDLVLKCQHCDYTSKLAALHQWTDHADPVSVCHRMPGSRKATAYAVQRNQQIEIHNAAADPQQLHQINPINVASSMYICQRCGASSSYDGKGPQAPTYYLRIFSRERCPGAAASS